jgi:hypothetical protein
MALIVTNAPINEWPPVVAWLIEGGGLWMVAIVMGDG